ncbi:MAG: YeeE/YedE family protein [bacterium]
MASLFPNGIASYLGGGLVIGAGLALLYLTLGVNAGASSCLSSTLTYFTPLTAERSSRDWRLAMALGTVAGAWLWALLQQGFFHTAVAPWRLALGGVLVGHGSRIYSGCTSGHGLMGLPSGSRASLQAVLVFMAVAIATAQALWHSGVRP